ncbi:SulP family inorganic anion transporter [Nocardioides pakistanensis]
MPRRRGGPTRASATSSPDRLAAFAPGLRILLGYRPEWLRGDLLAGITVAAYLVPQVMAYAEIAGLPPVVGLWAVVGPLLVYAFLGSSRQLSVGPESTTALMTAAAIGAMGAGDPDRYASLAAALALAVGVVCLLGYLGRLGFLADLLSRPVLVGYMAGIAVLMVASQLGKLSGMAVAGDTPLEQSWFTLTHLDRIELPTLGLATAVLVLLLLGQRLRPRWPSPLIVMLLAAAVVALFDLGAHGIDVVGSVPVGLPVPGLPDLDPEVVLELAVPAVGVAIVGYSDNVIEGRAFASRRHERIDANQEFLALGASNLASGLLHAFPVSSSGSRTAIGDALGSRTQLYSLVTLGTVLVTVFFLGPVLAAFPMAVEANTEIDLTGVDALDEVRRVLTERGIVFALARVKQDVRETLGAAGLLEKVGEDRIFLTLPTAVVAYAAEYEQRHGEPPPGVHIPKPPA